MKNLSAKKPFGLWIGMSLVIGNMIGSAIYLLPASLAAYGTISIFSWMFTTVGALLLALVFTDLNRRLPKTGGAFIYAKEVYGDFVGFATAASYWFAWSVANASSAVAAVGYMAAFFPVLNEQSVSFSSTLTLAVKISIIWAITALNVVGLKYAGRFQLLTTLLKLFPLILIGIVGAFKVNTANLVNAFNISNQSPLSAFTGAATLTLWAFIGLESAIIPADEMSCSKTIAKATIIGTIVTAIIYIVLTIVLLGMIPANILKNSTSPLSDAAMMLFGPTASIWMTGFALITIIGALNGSILVQAQDAMAAADHHLFPKSFAKRNKNNTPARGLMLSGIMMTILLLLTVQKSFLKQFNFLLLLSTLSFLIPYFISTTANLILLIKSEKNAKKKIKLNLIAFFASIYSFWMLIGVGTEIIAYGCLFFFALFWVYWLLKLWLNIHDVAATTSK